MNYFATPTYRTVADVLEKQNGSGLGLCWWTFARMGMIFPGLLLTGIQWRRALVGAGIASATISLFTLYRVKSVAEKSVQV